MSTATAISNRLLAVIVKEYATNERHNHHTANVTLLAEHFGTVYQKKVAKLSADILEVLGYLTSDADLRYKQESVRIALEKSFRDARTAAGI